MIDLEVAKTFDRRSALFLSVGTVLTSVLVLRMLQMQLFNHNYYTERAMRNSLRIRVNMAERGRIMATGNIPISRDIPIYRIYIIPEEADDLDALINNLATELSLRPRSVERIWRSIRRNAKFQPTLISENTEWNTLAGIATQNLNGVHIEPGFARGYEMGPAGAQIFGYTGAPRENVPGAPFWTQGVTGLEKTFDKTLAGKPGQTVMINNAVGRIVGEDAEQFVESVTGNNVMTTIDADAQKALYDALATHQAGCGVAIEIETGNIKAMVSAPSFDANEFRGDDADEYMETLRNDAMHPFMNKAVEGLYPPGSTFKIVVALAALESGALSPSEKIFCPGHWDYGDRRFNCWEATGHGWVNLADALKHSCDTYFYQIALRIGIDSIQKMALRLGLGDKYLTALFPNESGGLIPDRKWKEKNIGARWVHGDTIISGIGQGFVLTTCLELAVMMARVASNKNIIPRLIEESTEHRAQSTSLGLQQKNINYVLKGLEQVLQAGGTASGSAINVRGQKMGGKTGTSQVRSISRAERESGVLTNEQLQWRLRNHGLFVAYAPTTNPKYVVATITEHSGGSGPAARSAAAVMKELLSRGGGKPL